MNRIALSLLALAACAQPGLDAADDLPAPPPPALTLSVSALVPGDIAELTVSGAPANAKVWFVLAHDVGAGPCYAELAGGCVEVTDVIARKTKKAGQSGAARLSAIVPEDFPPGQYAFQAVSPDGIDSRYSNVVTVVVDGPTTVTDVRAGIADGSIPDGTPVTVAAIVTAVGPQGVWLQDEAGGPWSGIYAYVGATTSLLAGLDAGATVLVEGEAKDYFDLAEIDLSIAGTVTVTGAGTVPAPHPLTPDDASDPVAAEPWESALVRLTNVVVVDTNPDAPSDFGEFVVDEVDGTPEAIRVDDALYAAGPVDLDDAFTRIDGLLDYRYGNFKVVPRDAGDVDVATSSILTMDDVQYGDLILTEVMFNPNADLVSAPPCSSETDFEYFEILNTTASPIHLDGLSIIRDHDTLTTTTTFHADTVLAPGGRAVGVNGDSCYGLPTTLLYSFALTNSRNHLELWGPNGSLDAVDFKASGFSTPSGASLQLSADAEDADMNDSAAHWCASANAPIAGTTDHGTPLAPNATCP